VAGSRPRLQKFTDLIAIPPADLGNYDIAEINLACSAGLPGTATVSIEESLKTLDRWAEGAKRVADKNMFRFKDEPGKWANSENWFRVACLVRYLRTTARTEYDPTLKNHPSVARWDTSFYRDPSRIFMFGLLAGQRYGTCTSLPVLTVAVGRRMGFPLKLVRNEGHVFARWDGSPDGERFNIESTDQYAERRSEEFYLNWPEPAPQRHVASGYYMASMTPAQEAGMFCFWRGHCLWQNGDLAGARMAYLQGHHLDPLVHQDDFVVRLLARPHDTFFPPGSPIPMNVYRFCGNDPVNKVDPTGLENIIVSGTDGTRIFSQGVQKDSPSTTYLDYAGEYYFGNENYDSIGSFMAPLTFARKVWTMPLAFVVDIFRLNADTGRNLFEPNFYARDVAVNAQRVCEILEMSTDPEDVLMGHSQGVTLIAAGVAMASRSDPILSAKTIKLILLAPKVGFDALEEYIAEAKRNQPGWNIKVLIIGNQFDTAIPCGTEQGYIAHYDPSTKLAYEGIGSSERLRHIKLPGVHYGFGFPLARTSPHWRTHEFADPTDPHDSRKHVGVRPIADHAVEEINTPESEELRKVIRNFIRQ